MGRMRISRRRTKKFLSDMSLLISFAVNTRDAAIALTTLEWAHTLDGRVDYDCVLTLGAGVEREPILAAAQKYFRKVTVIDVDAPEAWPQGKNAAFQNLVRWLNENRGVFGVPPKTATGTVAIPGFMVAIPSFLWWEPDAVPLKRGWIAELEAAHVAGGKPFTGYVHEAIGVMDGVGIYPANFMEYSPMNGMLCRAAAWDVCARHEIRPQCHAINHLIQCVHDVDGLPPSFGVTPKGATGTVAIPATAVLFHRCKDGSLVEMLSKGKIRRVMERWLAPKSETLKAEIPKPERMTVVFPVCAKDIEQAVAHARWLQKLTATRWPNRALVAFDAQCPYTSITELMRLLGTVFATVENFVYPTPFNAAYPAVANYAFARVAEYMANGTAPWLWLEADSVVLARDWLERLESAYATGGKRFMGPVVLGMGHMNGCAVYPPDAVRRISRALSQTAVAFDYAMKPEMAGDCLDASHLFQHLWGLENGQASQTNGTQLPEKFTRELARRVVKPGAVLVHRVKDNSLTELLMAGGWG